MMIRTIEYIKEQDKLIKRSVLKASKATSKKAIAKTFKDFFIEATVLGIASSETDLELLGKKHFSERASRGFRIHLSDVSKTKNITDRASEFWDGYSLKLAGEFEDYKLRETEKMFRDKIKEGGYTRKDLLREVEEKLQIKSKVRLDMIVTTEMTKCFNYARVENAKENAKMGGIVRALKFMAIMDIHTSPTCQSRNGLVLALDDPRINNNTPPLHVRCRSMWGYVDKWDFEELYKGKSSPQWDSENISKTQPDSSWGNAFAYGGEKENLEKVEKNSIIKMQRMRDNLPKEYCDNIQGIMENAPKTCKDIWNKYHDKINIYGNYKGGAHYSPSKNIVNFSMERDLKNPFGVNTTVFHELGHLFDTHAGARMKGVESLSYQASKVYKENIFNETLKKEAKDYVNNVWNDLKKINKETKKIEAYSKLAEELKSIPLKARADISDIFDGAIGKNGGVGHGAAYWKYTQVSTEAFAEMLSATINNPDSLLSIKKYFPKSYEIFLEILEEVAKL